MVYTIFLNYFKIMKMFYDIPLKFDEWKIIIFRGLKVYCVYKLYKLVIIIILAINAL